MYWSAKISGEGSGLRKYCMVRLDRCRVVPTGQDKAGGGILLPKDGPGMCMCN